MEGKNVELVLGAVAVIDEEIELEFAADVEDDKLVELDTEFVDPPLVAAVEFTTEAAAAVAGLPKALASCVVKGETAYIPEKAESSSRAKANVERTLNRFVNCSFTHRIVQGLPLRRGVEAAANVRPSQ